MSGLEAQTKDTVRAKMVLLKKSADSVYVILLLYVENLHVYFYMWIKNYMCRVIVQLMGKYV
jgi:hypothetical protein